jgi:hypothetical protein
VEMSAISVEAEVAALSRRQQRANEFSQADIYYSLEHVADVLSTVNGSQAPHPQRHR